MSSKDPPDELLDEDLMDDSGDKLEIVRQSIVDEGFECVARRLSSTQVLLALEGGGIHNPWISSSKVKRGNSGHCLLAAQGRKLASSKGFTTSALPPHQLLKVGLLYCRSN